jgi:hypothetical protein
MENEQQSMHQGQREETNVDGRLAAFYGPPLPEQPLSAEAWMHLQTKLSTRRFPARRLMQRLLRRRYRHTYPDRLPSTIENAFAALVYEARLPQQRFPSRILRYSLKARRRTPVVCASSIGGPRIKLTLPLQPLEPPELDVLLATGLARLYCMSRPAYALKRLILLGIEPMAMLVYIVFWLRGLSSQFLPIAIVLLILVGLGVAGSLQVVKRSIAMQADVLMVQWIGRSRACSGLHLLAGRARTARRSRWGEPTLEERIARVCGTQVTVEHERLTMVR